jgi:DNA polymerase-1
MDKLILPNIRKMFIPPKGYRMFDIDLKSADLRIVAWESGEQELIDLLLAGKDPYIEIAKECYDDPSITKGNPKRQKFKAFAHSLHYFATDKGQSDKLCIPLKEVQKTRDWYFTRFPKIKDWQDRLMKSVNELGYVQNVWGYRGHFGGFISMKTYQEAAAWSPQSTIAVLINKIDKALEAADIIGKNWDACGYTVETNLQVHDSLVGIFPIEKPEIEYQILRIANSVIIPFNPPMSIPCDIKTSDKSWGDCR